MSDSGEVDFLNILVGHVDSDFGLSEMITGTNKPLGPHLNFCGDIRKEVNIPIFHAGKI